MIASACAVLAPLSAPVAVLLAGVVIAQRIYYFRHCPSEAFAPVPFQGGGR